MKKIVLIIGCIIIFFVGVGVRMHMNHETQEQELQRTEKSIAQKLISEYKSIKKIEFTKVSKIGDTSDVQFEFSVNDGPKLGIDVDGLSQAGIIADGDDRLEKTALKKENRLAKSLDVKDIALKNYHVVYYLKLN